MEKIAEILEMDNPKGAIEANNHYLKTGHYIKHFMKVRKLGFDIEDRVSKYVCQECSFASEGGSRHKLIY